MEKSEEFRLEIGSPKLEFIVEEVFYEGETHFKVNNRNGYLFTLVPSDEGNEFIVSKQDLALNPNINMDLVHKIADAIESRLM